MGSTLAAVSSCDLADLLGVEMNQLREGPKAVPATPEQRALVERMGNMTLEQQQALLAMAAAFTTPGQPSGK